MRDVACRLPGWFLGGLVLAVCAAGAEAQTLRSEAVVTGLSGPTWVGAAPGDPRRLFVADRDGLIRVVESGNLLPLPFLDLRGFVRAEGDGGFLGLAFHPDYQSNGFVYAYFSTNESNSAVVRFTASGDPNAADPLTAFPILHLVVDRSNDLHYGGFIGFSPVDGNLYLTTGDAGPQGDPFDNAQDPESVLGKILRIDVDAAEPYAVPGDNPFVGVPGVLDEIWAGGFRNPWRASFDRETGDLWVGDVGFFRWEEIDFIPAGDGGGNYGWARKEGTHCFDPPEDCDPAGELIDPILEYRHTIVPFRCAVMGGHVYRGASIPLLRGTYFFADFCSNEIFSMRYDGIRITELTERTGELSPAGFVPSIVSFGEDADGELYIVDITGVIFKITTKMQIETGDLLGGESGLVRVRGVTPGALVGLAYSTRGVGETPVPAIGATLALKDPVLVRTATADASGEAVFAAEVPPSAVGATVWLQAAEAGNTSNVLTREVLGSGGGGNRASSDR